MLISRDLIGEKLISGKPALFEGQVVSQFDFPDYDLSSDIFWRQIEDANSGTFKTVNAEEVTSFFVFPVYNSLSIFVGSLFCTMTDADDTDFTLRITFQDTVDKTI